ncbi:RICIN domain-containing protein [Streptomyces sp. NPDC059452]|uniref:RICIN domain-containing protein n=1 Tax=Streptomyces sp. NPDC059452 TaxID=3346835 RepID=UPI003698EE26
MNSVPGAVQIISDRSRLPANVKSFSTQPSAPLEQWPQAGGADAASQQWILEVEDEFRAVLDLPAVVHPGIGDIHRMNSYQPTSSRTTRQVEVGAICPPGRPTPNNRDAQGLLSTVTRTIR